MKTNLQTERQTTKTPFAQKAPAVPAAAAKRDSTDGVGHLLCNLPDCLRTGLETGKINIGNEAGEMGGVLANTGIIVNIIICPGGCA
jgi:hypothetical protein